MRLLVAISHHGLGHLAQAAPVVDALHRARPDLAFLVWSGLPEAALAARIRAPFGHRHAAADVGLVMHDAVRVDPEASRAAYLAFHRDWDARVAHEGAWLREQGVAGVLADVASLPLAAAAAAGLPGVALCSLNWVDVAGAYLAEQAGMAVVLAQMAAAYRSARVFLRPTPAMPMGWLDNLEALPPIAAQGTNRRAELRARLALPPDARLVLIGFGGIGYATARRPPVVAGVRWLVPDEWGGARTDLIPLARLGVPFIDLLASVDALITKVGYGSFVEAAALGLPVLYIDRPDWPETPCLTDWLLAHANAAAIGEAELFAPAIGERLADLWRRPARAPAATPGAEAAARRILEILYAVRE